MHFKDLKIFTFSATEPIEIEDGIIDIKKKYVTIIYPDNKIGIFTMKNIRSIFYTPTTSETTSKLIDQMIKSNRLIVKPDISKIDDNG